MSSSPKRKPSPSSRPEPENAVIGTPPPHSLGLENKLISAVLMDETGDAWAIAQQVGVRSAAFFGGSQRRLWQVVADMRARGAATTVPVVYEELQLTGELEEIGMDALLEMTSAVVSTREVRAHAEQLVLFWQLRHALTLCQQVREAVVTFENREAFSAAVGEVGQKFIRFGHREAVRSLEEQIDAVKKDVLERAAGREDRSGWVYTGLPTFDDRCRPLSSAREDQLTAVCGGSGHGKSALMRQWAGNALLAGKRVLFYTRETSTEGFIEQLAASWCGLDLMNLEDTAKLWPARLVEFEQKCDWLRDEVADKRLWVVQHEPATPLVYIDDLESHYRTFSHLHGHPDLIAVDYLQLFLPRKKCNNREQEVAIVSHALQALCRSSGKPWLIGVQLNEAGLAAQRVAKHDEAGNLIHRLPVAGDLRESQAIFHDADRVIAIYRPPEDVRGQDNLGPNVLKPEQWLCQIKRRKGGTGAVKCWFERNYTRFAEMGGGRGEGGGSAVSDTPKGVPSGGTSLQDYRKRNPKK